MHNKVQVGHIIDVTLDSPCKGGDLVIFKNLLGVAVSDGEKGETIALDTQGVFEFMQEGAELYALANFENGKINSQGKGPVVGVVVDINGSNAYVKINPFIGNSNGKKTLATSS